MRKSEKFAFIAILSVIFEVVCGAALGFVFSTGGFLEYFNWSIAAVCWIISLFTIPPLYAMYALISNQEEIIENTSK